MTRPYLSYVWRPGDLPPRELLTTLAPGVTGYAVEYQGALWLPVIEADLPGRGYVGRYLDTLPRDRAIAVPTVIAPKLATMLRRRGFHCRTMYVHARVAGVGAPEPSGWDPLEVWLRPPVPLEAAR